MMTAIIGGSGLAEFEGLVEITQHEIDTPYGTPSAAIIEGELAGERILFLARHGNPHVLPPHKVNYRANIWALKKLGADQVVAVNAVGGITEAMAPGVVVVPDQIVDYSYGREHTYADSAEVPLLHVDFTQPYDEAMRIKLNAVLAQQVVVHVGSGVHGVTQGPRLESAAEVVRLERDGCDVVGMTGMPEAALVRELELPFACLCLVVNWAAGKTDELITMDDIHAVLDDGIGQVRQVLSTFITA